MNKQVLNNHIFKIMSQFGFWKIINLSCIQSQKTADCLWIGCSWKFPYVKTLRMRKSDISLFFVFERSCASLCVVSGYLPPFSSNNCVLVQVTPLPPHSSPALPFLLILLLSIYTRGRNVPPFQHQSLDTVPTFFFWGIAPSAVPLDWLLNLSIGWSLSFLNTYTHTHTHNPPLWQFYVLAWVGWTIFARIPFLVYF